MNRNILLEIKMVLAIMLTRTAVSAKVTNFQEKKYGKQEMNAIIKE